MKTYQRFLILALPVFYMAIALFHNRCLLTITYSGVSMGIIVFLIMDLFYSKESFDRPDVFPWNEANLVKKRMPFSTVIDCEWDTENNGEIFCPSDPVIQAYTTSS